MALSGKGRLNAKSDLLNLNLLDITHNRLNRKKWGRNTFFGASTEVDTTERIISPDNSTVGLEISFPPDARIMSIASSNVNDTSAGTGTQTLIVRGLDANYNQLDEEISMNGQTKVDTINMFIRVNDIFTVNAGSNGFNLGNIYCSDNTDTFINGIPQTRLYLVMGIGDNISKTAIYTVPDGKTWTSTFLYLQTTATESNPMEVKLYINNIKRGGNTFSLREKFYVQGSTQIDMSGNTQFPEKGDMYMTAKKTGGGGNQEIHIKMFAIERIGA